ncbi:hypothetical protein M5K25_019281 [Dendrobium thyrsiflorum]|uniref:Reverse transcriptase domain-containing protein n=1 Tax=Dendrobium thyrsiflorum TaxID=117978 RepID=A0ABD0UED1_DENTH
MHMTDFQLSHLIYADDLLVFGRADSLNCTRLMRTLNMFSNFSGLQLNLQKSSLIISPYVSCPNDISMALQIFNPSPKITYLGIPISLGRIKISDFDPLLEKVTSLLSGWRARLLSFDGRLQYIKYTITNTVAYWIRCSIIPKSICKAIGKLCSKFLYHGALDSRRLQLISWYNTCKPHSFGGLGIASLQGLHFAYNCSIIMRCYNMPSPLSKWLLARYYSPWKPPQANDTAFWKSICNSTDG